MATKARVYEGLVIRRQYRVPTLAEAQKVLARFYEGTYFQQQDGSWLVLIF